MFRPHAWRIGIRPAPESVLYDLLPPVQDLAHDYSFVQIYGSYCAYRNNLPIVSEKNASTTMSFVIPVYFSYPAETNNEHFLLSFRFSI